MRQLPSVIGSVAASLAVLMLVLGLVASWPLSGRAHPADPAAPLSTILFGSCNDQKLPQAHWEPMRAAGPDLVVMLGDNVYGSTPLAESTPELPALRQAYAALAAEPGFQRLRAAVPVLAIWDDHDYGLNDGGGDFPWRRQAEALFLDFWQVPADDPRHRRDGLYTAETFGPPGQRVQVILLDTRSFRSPLKPTDERNAPGKERYLPDPDPAKTLLGAAQWAWLADRLREPADLRLLVSSIQVLADGHGFERWGNLPAERDRLFALLRDTRAGGVVLLSGDRHVGGLYRRDDVLGYPLIEVTSSSFNRPWRGNREPGPHRIGTTVDAENFGRIAIDWDAGSVRLAVAGLDGKDLRTIEIPLAELRP